jgi:hypothetical protein
MRAFGTAAQVSIQSAARVVLLPLLVVELVGGANASWIIVASLVVCAAVTAASMIRVGPLRSTSLYVAVADPMSIPFCVLALEFGGAVTLAVLVVVAGMSQIAAGLWLASLRRFITPGFSITLVLLACISVLPVFARAIDAPAGARWASAVPVCMALTAAVIYAMNRLGSPVLKPWAPPAGLAVGAAAALVYGIYDVDLIADAAWIGLPASGWIPTGSIDPLAVAMLAPSFVILSLVQVARANSSSLMTQLVSGRLVLDFREVQRANARIGAGSVLAGIGGTIPLGYSPAGPAALLQTGGDPRRIRAPLLAVFVAVAASPKLQAALIALPRALVVVYFVSVLAILVTKLVPVSPLKRRAAPAVMWVPVGAGVVFEVAGAALGDARGLDAINGLTAGSIVLIALTARRALRTRRHRVDLALAAFSADEIKEFVSSLPVDSEELKDRLTAVSEEALMVLIQSDVHSYDPNRQVRLTVTLQGAIVEAEFVAAPSGAQNLQERIMLLSEPEARDLEAVVERDAALRLLNHYATAVTHRQYRDVEVITAVVA